MPGLRFYKVAFAEQGQTGADHPYKSYVATLSFFPRETAASPKEWVQAIANVQLYEEHDRGGHFPSVECAVFLVGDLKERFGSEIVKPAMESGPSP